MQNATTNPISVVRISESVRHLVCPQASPIHVSPDGQWAVTYAEVRRWLWPTPYVTILHFPTGSCLETGQVTPMKPIPRVEDSSKDPSNQTPTVTFHRWSVDKQTASSSSYRSSSCTHLLVQNASRTAAFGFRLLENGWVEELTEWYSKLESCVFQAKVAGMTIKSDEAKKLEVFLDEVSEDLKDVKSEDIKVPSPLFSIVHDDKILEFAVLPSDTICTVTAHLTQLTHYTGVDLESLSEEKEKSQDSESVFDEPIPSPLEAEPRENETELTGIKELATMADVTTESEISPAKVQKDGLSVAPPAAPPLSKPDDLVKKDLHETSTSSLVETNNDAQSQKGEEQPSTASPESTSSDISVIVIQ